jgi:hypothetical protein
MPFLHHFRYCFSGWDPVEKLTQPVVVASGFYGSESQKNHLAKTAGIVLN